MFARSKRVINRDNTRSLLTIINQNERGVKLNLGKFNSVLEPGLRLNIPFYHEITKVNISNEVKYMPRQSLISKDNVTFYIDSSIQYKIIDVKKAVLNVVYLDSMLLERAQMSLRKTLGSLEINDILHDLEDTSIKIKESLSDIEDEWGVLISNVQLKDISFEDSMKRAMAVKAEADRNAQAKIISAKADIETAKMYSQAAEIYSENPVTLKLREYQLWNSISKNPGSSIYVVPSNFMDFVKK